jgi:hypothetical protein
LASASNVTKIRTVFFRLASNVCVKTPPITPVLRTIAGGAPCTSESGTSTSRRRLPRSSRAVNVGGALKLTAISAAPEASVDRTSISVA